VREGIPGTRPGHRRERSAAAVPGPAVRRHLRGPRRPWPAPAPSLLRAAWTREPNVAESHSRLPHPPPPAQDRVRFARRASSRLWTGAACRLAVPRDQQPGRSPAAC